MSSRWAWSTEELVTAGTRHRLVHDGSPVTWATFADLVVDDASFRLALTTLLSATEHSAIYWETPPVSGSTKDRPFEMVVLRSTHLARVVADSSAFDEHLATSTDLVQTFANLGGDARIIVPCARGRHDAYAHLAAFLRGAPIEQVGALWQTLGHEVRGWWSTRDDPVWVSTAGDGVPWLHVRLDTRPKYYKHHDYKRFAPSPAGSG